ncbi:MAG: DHHA1 domain-containing protein [Candidatus Nanoarchaeia archaeon]
MINKKQLKEIREYLEKAQNPVFFFDNDVDGLCSFLLLQRAIGRGKGVAIKSFPEMHKNYMRKVREFNADYIFILDKPKVSQEFIDEASQTNIPVIWIDHHNVPLPDLKEVKYYNSYPEGEPVTYIAYKVFENKKDIWLAMIGCIGDVYLPEFAEEFAKNYPELFSKEAINRGAFDALYLTELGKLVNMLNFGLKDKTTNVVRLMKLLMQANSPYDLLQEDKKTKQLHKRYEQLNKIYKKILEKSKRYINPISNIIFFTYKSRISMSSEIANALYFKHKDKLIIVGYKNPDKITFSIRGKEADKITSQAIKNIEGASGGGHPTACGAQIPPDKLEEFKQNINQAIDKL